MVESPAADPVAVTVFGVPLLLKMKPADALENVQVPPPLPPVVIVQRVGCPELDTVIVVSVDANPLAVTVTVTPDGPEDGLSVKERTVPVNVAVVESPAVEPAAVIVFAVPVLLNPIPFVVLAVNVQEPDPTPVPEKDAVIVHRVTRDGFSTMIVVSVEAKPFAVAVTVMPVGPERGLSVSESTVPVKVAVVESLADEPTAVTVFDAPLDVNVKPFAPLTVNEQEPPPPLAVMVHSVVSAGFFTAIVASVDAKPLAVAVTLVPSGPASGLRVRESVVPVNVAVAVSPAVFPVAVTVFAALLKEKPFELVGTNVQLPPPFVSELTVHNGAELGLVTATLVSVDANPATVAVTVTPLGPDDGVSDNVGAGSMASATIPQANEVLPRPAVTE